MTVVGAWVRLHVRCRTSVSLACLSCSIPPNAPRPPITRSVSISLTPRPIRCTYSTTSRSFRARVFPNLLLLLILDKTIFSTIYPVGNNYTRCMLGGIGVANKVALSGHQRPPTPTNCDEDTALDNHQPNLLPFSSHSPQRQGRTYFPDTFWD